MKREVEKLKAKQVNPLFSKYEDLVKKNSQLRKEVHLNEYKLRQQEQDYNELESLHITVSQEKKKLEIELAETITECNKLREVKIELELKMEKMEEEYQNNLNNYQNCLVLLNSSQEKRKDLEGKLL